MVYKHVLGSSGSAVAVLLSEYTSRVVYKAGWGIDCHSERLIVEKLLNFNGAQIQELLAVKVVKGLNVIGGSLASSL